MSLFGIKAGYSVIDQLVMSGANFALNIILVRLLVPEDYGIFAIVFSIFLFLAGFHNALIIEPMSVIGPSHYGSYLRDYIAATLWLHSVVTIGIGMILMIIGSVLVANEQPIGISLLGVALATPFILLHWLLRRACYIDARPMLAVKGSLMYVTLLMFGLLLLWMEGWVTPFYAFLLMGVSSVGVSILLLWLLGIDFDRVVLRTWETLDVQVVIVQHWNYGKWVVGSAFVQWISSVGYLPLVGMLVGFSQAGVLRAMQNLILPLQQVLTALGHLWLPWNARALSTHGKSCLGRHVLLMMLGSMAIAVPYLTMLLFFAQPLTTFLYGAGFYEQFQWLTYYLGVFAALSALGHSIIVALRALQRPDCVFFSQLGGALLTATLGLTLVWYWGLMGAALGLMGSAGVATIILWTQFQISYRRA